MSQPPQPPLPTPPPAPAFTPPPAEPTLLHKVFVGRGGIRAGWRLLIFFAILFALGAAANLAFRLATRGRQQPGAVQELSPTTLLIGEAVQFTLLLLVTFVMSRIEKRRIGDYGLALSRGFRKTFWEGAFYGFGGITLVLAVMHFAGHYDFGTLALHGGAIFRYGALFLVGFLGVGFFEEYTFRGYFLYTLTDGLSGLGPISPRGGFLIAVVLVSSLFGLAHSANQGETAIGLASVVIFSLVFCFVLWRTGDLWMAVGFHMAWDWGQTYLYGVPDSGIPSEAHLLAPSFHGPDWWTGGSVGPEASFLCPLVLLLVALLVHLRYRSVKYPLGVSKG